MKKNLNSASTVAEDSKQAVKGQSSSSDQFWEKELEALPKPPSSPKYEL